MAVEPLFGTRAQKAFIFTIAVQAIAVLVMIGIVFRMVEEHVSFTTTRYKTLPCYLALFALAEIFELLMAVDALRLRNIIQLIGILLFHLSLIVMAALQVRQTHTALVQLGDCDGSAGGIYYIQCGGPHSLWKKIEPFLIVAPCILLASWLLLLFWIKELYAEFGWAIFHVVGANPKMKTMYQYYQVMVCLLKFDFFSFSGVTMQLLIVVLNHNAAEFGITIAAIPIVLILLLFCGVALRREIKWLMTISLILMLAAMSYFLYKLVRFYQPFPYNENPYISTRATLTIFTIAAFLLLFATFAIGLRCFADFDRGLREAKTDDVTLGKNYLTGLPSPGKGNMTETQTSSTGGAQLGPRISIE